MNIEVRQTPSESGIKEKERQKAREIPLPFKSEADPFKPFSEISGRQYREIVNYPDDLNFRDQFSKFTSTEGVIELDFESEQLTEVIALGGGKSLVLYGKIAESGIEIVGKPEAYANHKPEFLEKKDYDRRAMAALLLERFLGLNFTPPTEAANIILENKECRGTIQHFRPGKNTFELDARDIRKLYEDSLDEMELMAVLDIVCFSGDNHQGNIIITPEKPVTIDRSIAFSKERGFRSFPVRDIADDIFFIYSSRRQPRGDLKKYPEILARLDLLCDQKGIPRDLWQEIFLEEERQLIREQAGLLLKTKNIEQAYKAIKQKYKVIGLPEY